MQMLENETKKTNQDIDENAFDGPISRPDTTEN